MSWEQVTTATELMKVTVDGVVKWNTRMQAILGDARWVTVFWDSSERRLGIRAGSSGTGTPVIAEPEGSEWWIDSADMLDNAGIVVGSSVEAVPTKWYRADASAPVDPLYGYPYQPIFYVVVPE